ncbi:MAG TPA: hypothetical protein GXZ32_08190 [Clostridiales bacterium]|jgi:membrane protease YdiL (CAAX protease family)|nr:hypothetical protein [Clostridiales bacterium]
MGSIISVVMAAVLSYFFNKAAIKAAGNKAIVYIVPFIEEGFKTFITLALGGIVLLTHISFGIIEGIYDYFNSNEKINFTACFISVVSHSIFGVVTTLGFVLSKSWYPGLMAAILCHILWNWRMFRRI